jgi:hypothetical protein
MLLPVTDQGCFFVVTFGFGVVGFMRGWRREIVSLVFVLLAVFLIHPDSAKTFGQTIVRLPAVIGYLATGTPQPAPDPPIKGPLVPWESLALFFIAVVVGYVVGNKVFARPAAHHERFIGIIPALISGAFILAYVDTFLSQQGGQPRVTVAVGTPDPANYLPILFVVAIIALVIALIAARAKKTPAKK